MPYISRDSAHNITRVDVRPIMGAEMVPYDNPELVAFLSDHGQEPKQVDELLIELRRTDVEMTRAIEDVIMALLKKNILKMADLPAAVQDRMAYRVKLRVMIQEIYNKASDNR